MVTIYNTTLSATSQRHFSDGLGGVVYLFQKFSYYEKVYYSGFSQRFPSYIVC